MIVKCQPIFGGEPLMCTSNVAKRIRALGGSAVYGWLIDPDPNTDKYVRKMPHCVWRSPGGELQDVTPYFTGERDGEIAFAEFKDIEFEPDDSCNWGEGRCTINGQYVATDPRLNEACRFMTIADSFMNTRDLDKCRYWTGRANKAAERVGFPGWDTPASLGMADYITALNR
jgi:hypothetical protein